MILDGKLLAEKIYSDLEKEITEIKKAGINPSLAVILVGEDAASLAYIRAKEKAALALGIDFKCFQLPQIVSKEKVLELIEDLNRNKFIHAIVVQLPLPGDLPQEEIIARIAPEKDVDGFNGKFTAPTAKAIWKLFEFYNIKLEDKKIVIIGHGMLVGQPLEKLFRDKGIKADVLTSKSQDMSAKLKTADIIVSATGVPGLVRPDMIKEGVVLIDAGTAESNGKLSGDIGEDSYRIASSYSPVPGGVGPMTVAMLLENLVEAAKS